MQELQKVEGVPHNQELALIVKKSNVKKETANIIVNAFTGFFEESADIIKFAKAIYVNSTEQVEEVKQAKELRKRLVKIRLSADSTRKDLKAETLLYNKTIQEVYNTLETEIEKAELHLKEQETFIERIEAEKKAQTKLLREQETIPYKQFIPVGIDLSNLSDDDYAMLLNGAKLQLKAKQDEEERLRQEEIKRIEEEKRKQEEARLQKEAEDKRKAIYDSRLRRALPYQAYITNFDNLDIMALSEEEFNNLIANAVALNNKEIEEKEKIRQENQKLKEEKEAQEAFAKLEKNQREAEQKEKDRKAKEELDKALLEKRKAELQAEKEAEARQKAEKATQDAEQALKNEVEKIAKETAEKEALKQNLELDINSIFVSEIVVDDNEWGANSSIEINLKEGLEEKTIFSVSDGEIEDANLGRDFSDAYNVYSLLKEFYNMGLEGKKVIFK